MNSITKERIELFIKNPLENGLTRGEQMELARIALASLEAEPVVYMWDSERKDIDAPGYYRTEHLVFAESSVKQWGGRVVPLYTAPPATVVPDERAAFNAWNNDENLPIAGVGAKNAAWLAWQARARRVGPLVSCKLSGNSG